MSKLELRRKPSVQFDPANAEHRKFAAEFFENGTWGDQPYRFILDERFVDLVTLVTRDLTRYYLESEFKSKSKAKKAA